MARYWVGGSADWNSTAGTKWATTSGGAGGASVPTVSDDVFFDAASGAGTATVNGSGYALSLNFSGYTGTLAGTSSGSVYVNGSLTFGAGMTCSYLGYISLQATTTGHTITTNGITFPGTLELSGTGGEWTLQDHYAGGRLRPFSGSFVANNKNVTVDIVDIPGSATITVTMGSGTWIVTGWWSMSGAGATIAPGTSTIKMTATNPIFDGGGKTYNNLWFSAGSGTKTLSGSNTFYDLKAEPNATLKFTSGSTTTVTTFTVVGTAGNLITITSTGASPHYLVATAPITGSDYLTISYSYASPEASWTAGANCVNAGTNLGWFALTFPAWNGVLTNVAVGGIDAAVIAAIPGDILVLAEGTHTLLEDIPDGVTIRGDNCDTSLTVLNVVNITPLSRNTFRDLTVTSSGTAFALGETIWFENVTFDGCCVTTRGPDTGQTLTFSRCTFNSTVEENLFRFDDIAVGETEWRSCLFLNSANGVSTPIIYANDWSASTVGLVHGYLNCTFIINGNRPVWATDMAFGSSQFYNNLLYGPSLIEPGFGDAGDLDTGDPTNFYTDSATNPSGETYWTYVADLRLDPVTHAPRNSSPIRTSGLDAPILDRNYLPYVNGGGGSGTCPGAYQWRDESGALYRPWFLDPVSGFSMTYTGVAATLAATSGATIVPSHLAVACLVRRYVHDMTHPSLGDFYVTWDGYYRLRVYGGTFGLTLSGDAQKVFGVYSATSQTDTG